MANLLLFSKQSTYTFDSPMKHLEKEVFIKKIGNKIRSHRENQNLSLESLAHQAGIDYSQISRIENGKINTSIYNLYMISNALGLPIKDFFDQ